MTDQTREQPALRYERRPLAALTLDPRNARAHDRANIDAIKESLARFGQRLPVVVRQGQLVGGNATTIAADELGWTHLDVVVSDDLSEEEARRLAVMLNRSAELATWNASVLVETLQGFPDLEGTGFTAEQLNELESLASAGSALEVGPAERPPSLAERFIVPPFSVLDARQGYWQDRKRAWLSLGIESEIGRGGAVRVAIDDGAIRPYHQRIPGEPTGADALAARGGYLRRASSLAGRGRAGLSAAPASDPETGHTVHDDSPVISIFDPVICELAYRWFCPGGGSILDPFAGGSVRGIVAAWLGHPYTGIDLLPEQIAANQEQAGRILSNGPPPTPADAHLEGLTPIEEHAGIFVKRDDAYRLNGAVGGKARAARRLGQDAQGMVGIGARNSPQLARVARVAQHLSLPCRVHTGEGAWTEEMRAAAAAGAEVVQHSPGRLTVLKARARDDATERGWAEIPFGGATPEAVEETAAQAANLPACARIVVPVGSGTTAAGILHGLRAAGRDTPILGIRVGADPTDELDRLAPGWRDQLTLLDALGDFDTPAAETQLGDIQLDAYYEAKCLPYLEPGDLLWIVGIREAAQAPSQPQPQWLEGDSRDLLPGLPDGSTDLLFTCPPYYDLEIYSDDPRDLSRADNYQAFRDGYAKILTDAARCLRPNRFAVLVIGEVRDPRGLYHGLVPDTIRIMEDVGCRYYNEAILVTAAGSLPMRAARMFQSNRKLGKTHQNVLVFFKGDPRSIADTYGTVEVSPLMDEADLADGALTG